MVIGHTRLEGLIFNCLDLGGCGLLFAVKMANVENYTPASKGSQTPPKKAATMIIATLVRLFRRTI
uniref:Uncharacterized protein n=1 Tax=Oryza brachyantha TaxID=4533 RepID=J3N876_ORYBR